MPETPDLSTDTPSVAAEPLLPDDFLFGVCTSAYHSEGGYNTPGGPHNHWAGWEATGRIERSGEANRLWDDPEPYIQKAASLGLNAFRFGIEWSRVQPSYGPEPLPKGAEPPPWDEDALDHYAHLCRLVWDAGMEPVVTLWHFVSPAWVGGELWLRPRMIALFEAFVERTVTHVNRRLVETGHPPLRFFVTFNEPFNGAAGPFLAEDHPPGRTDDFEAFQTMLVELLACHVRLYNRLHDLYEAEGWRTPHVGFNVVTYASYELDKVMVDLVRMRERGIDRADLATYLEARKARFEAAYDTLAQRHLGLVQRLYRRTFLRMVARKFATIDFTPLFEALDAAPRDRALDYLALDCYDPFIIGELRIENPFRKHTATLPKGRRPWWEWRFEPDIYRTSIQVHAEDAEGLPVYVLETNIVHHQPLGAPAEPRPDGLTRSQFLRQSLGEILRLRADGFPLLGYFYWSMTDNYEWGSYALRMGLLAYDYETHTIAETDGLGDPTAATLRDLIAALRSSDPALVRAAFQDDRHAAAIPQATS